MSRNWTHPRDFTLALQRNNKWNPDIVLRLYRGLNPSISRPEAIEAFKSLNVLKTCPKLPEIGEVDEYPTNFQDAVKDGEWNWSTIYSLYAQCGETDKEKVHYHFQSLKLTPLRPMTHVVGVPASCFHPLGVGTVYLPARPVPSYDAPDMPKQPPPKWFLYLVDKMGYPAAYKLVAYNLREYYEYAPKGETQ